MAQVAGRDSGLVPASTVPLWPAESKAHLVAISLGTAPAAWLCAKGSCVHGDLQQRARVTNHPPSHTPCLRRFAHLSGRGRSWSAQSHLAPGPTPGKQKRGSTGPTVQEHLPDPLLGTRTWLLRQAS